MSTIDRRGLFRLTALAVATAALSSCNNESPTPRPDPITKEKTPDSIQKIEIPEGQTNFTIGLDLNPSITSVHFANHSGTDLIAFYICQDPKTYEISVSDIAQIPNNDTYIVNSCPPSGSIQLFTGNNNYALNSTRQIEIEKADSHNSGLLTNQ